MSFFFQAEDGIRDVAVTGVQTCALPISAPGCRRRPAVLWDAVPARCSAATSAPGARPPGRWGTGPTPSGCDGPGARPQGRLSIACCLLLGRHCAALQTDRKSVV